MRPRASSLGAALPSGRALLFAALCLTALQTALIARLGREENGPPTGGRPLLLGHSAASPPAEPQHVAWRRFDVEVNALCDAINRTAASLALADALPPPPPARPGSLRVATYNVFRAFERGAAD